MTARERAEILCGNDWFGAPHPENEMREHAAHMIATCIEDAEKIARDEQRLSDANICMDVLRGDPAVLKALLACHEAILRNKPPIVVPK